MKIKNYTWNGFGFPVLFKELPAIRLRGELVPDVDFTQFAAPLVKIICSDQEIPLSGNQVKFIRSFFGLSMRQFADFMNVTHVSVSRWEEKGKSAAKIDVNTEIVLRLKVLKKLNSSDSLINEVVERVNDTDSLKPSPTYVKDFPPINYPGISEQTVN